MNDSSLLSWSVKYAKLLMFKAPQAHMINSYNAFTTSRESLSLSFSCLPALHGRTSFSFSGEKKNREITVTFLIIHVCFPDIKARVCTLALICGMCM